MSDAVRTRPDAAGTDRSIGKYSGGKLLEKEKDTMHQFLNQEEKKLFYRFMERIDAEYDDTQSMVTEWRGEHGYHSTLHNCIVHFIYKSLEYAYDLMGRGGEEDYARAGRILRKVLPLQDADPAHDTYGIWPYYLEEPLEQMAPPDWNMADFNGKKLLQLLLDYGGHIAEDLIEAMKQAIFHACKSIMLRNMGPHYSNISIMGTYVTLAAGEYLKEKAFFDYGKKRLKELYRFNMELGAYQEYNSPSYTWIMIADLTGMMTYLKDEESLGMIGELNDLAWRCLAEHYHYRTKQWAGPHSRFYEMLQGDQLLAQIQRALKYQMVFVPLDKPELEKDIPFGFFANHTYCPDRYLSYFTGQKNSIKPRTVFHLDEEKADTEIAVTHLEEKFALGTFYRSVFWNQKRNHISYFGTEKEPAYCILRCLHDGYDYSSGQIVTAQNKNRTVSVIGFATDGGDTHVNLDKIKDAAITASDLRIRFEIGGAAKKVKLYQISESNFMAEYNGTFLRIEIPYAKFGSEPVRLEMNTLTKADTAKPGQSPELIKCIDIVLYQGNAATIDFKTREQCCCAIYFEISSLAPVNRKPAIAYLDQNKLIIQQEELCAEGCADACTLMEFRKSAKAYVEGKEYLE